MNKEREARAAVGLPSDYVGYGAHRDCDELARAVANINQALDKLDVQGVRYDSIVVQGMSGAVPGGIVAHARHKQLVIIRKPNEGAHSTGADGPRGWQAHPFIILDDFIDRGRTMARILAYTVAQNPPVGAVFYCRESASVASDVTFYRTQPVGKKAVQVSHLARFTPTGDFLYTYQEEVIA